MVSEMKTPTWHTMEGDAVIQEQDTRHPNVAKVEDAARKIPITGRSKASRVQRP